MIGSGSQIKIQDGFDAALSILDEVAPNGCTSVFDLLQVVEYQVELGDQGNVVTVQIIVNPWSWPNLIPTVDLVGVSVREPTEARLVNSTEGRYRLTDEGSTLREWWSSHRQLTELFDSVWNWIDGNHASISASDGHPQPTSMGFGLRYPRGIAELLVQLSMKVEREHLDILDVNGLSTRDSIQRALEAVRNDLPPPREDPIENGEIQTRLESNHYHLTGIVNGVPVRFMVDTGATSTTLSISDAIRVGIDVNVLQPNSHANTAGGVVPICMMILPEIQFGSLVLRDVVVAIVMNEGNSSLFGMEVLNRFSSIEIRDGIMRLRP